MISEQGDINHIFDEFEQDKVPIWDIIELFERGRNIHELEEILNERPYIASNILYIMSELTSKRVLPIWRSAANFTSSQDLDLVYYALDIIHYLLPHISTEEALSLLDEVRVHEKSIDNKIRAITEALNARK